MRRALKGKTGNPKFEIKWPARFFLSGKRLMPQEHAGVEAQKTTFSRRRMVA
jgi:hypothetical protein